MAARKKKTPPKTTDMIFFGDHEDQDAKDLAYGDQKPGCKDIIKRNKKKTGYEDASFSGDWTPDTD